MTLDPTPVTPTASQKTPYSLLLRLGANDGKASQAMAKGGGASKRYYLVRMNRVDPKYLLRNDLAQIAIEKAQ